MNTLHAEWTKLRTAPGTLGLLLGLAVAVVGVSVCRGGEPRLPDRRLRWRPDPGRADRRPTRTGGRGGPRGTRRRYLFPVVALAASDPTWHRRLQQIGPSTAGLGIEATVDLHDLVLSPWAGLGVLALWALGWLVVGGLVLTRHDA